MRRRRLLIPLVFYGALVLLLIVAPQVLAKRDTTTTCTGSLSHATMADLNVPEGAVCRVSGSTVNGSVTVERDAYFEASATKINGAVRAAHTLTVFLHDGTVVSGNVIVEDTAQLFLYKATVGGTAKVTGAAAPGYGHVQVCNTSVGAIEIRASGPDVMVGDPEAGCPGNRVGKDVVITRNHTMSELDVSGNVIGGSLLVTDNTGSSPKRVMNNSVLGRIDLSNNASPFDASAQPGYTPRS